MEAIQVGDKVQAQNRATGKLEYKPVTALTHPHRDKLLEIRVEGEHDPLRPSAGHPFWVKRGDAQEGVWMPSGQMQVGDRLLTLGGQWRRVTSITPVEQPETVYNFTVAKDHDYFVGQTGLLVHNAGPCGCTDPPAWITPGSLPPDEENLLLDTLSHIDNGTVPTGPTGIKWGSPFNNWGTPPYLPGGQGPGLSPYQEYRVGSGGLGAGARRIVHNPATGEAYYTWTHYGQAGCPGFVRIR